MCIILPEQGDISYIQLYAVFTLQVVANATEANIQNICEMCVGFSFSPLSVLFCALCIKAKFASLMELVIK